MSEDKITNEEKLKQERAEHVKDMLSPVDGVRFFELLKKVRDTYTENEKEQFTKDMLDIFDRLGRQAVLRAIDDGLLTDAEFKTLEMAYSDYATFLQAYYNKKDYGLKDKMIVVTQDITTPLCKNRAFIKKRFGVTVMTAEEGIEYLEKNKNKTQHRISIPKSISKLHN